MFSKQIQENNEAKLIFQFIYNEANENNECLVDSIEIIQEKIKIDLNKSNKYEKVLVDVNQAEYKTYDCIFNFKDNTSNSFSITVYYWKINYYLCGIKKENNSAEILFSDFFSGKINNSNCFILYGNIKYYPSEDFELKTRKRINLINISLKKLQIPNNLNKEKIDVSEKLKSKNYQFFLSVTNNIQKTVAIFKNESFSEPIIMNYNLIIKLLENTIEKAQSILNYKSNYDYKEYYLNIKTDEMKILSNNIRTSESLENKISDFFIKYRPNPTNEELKIYELYSEFMLLFPSLKGYPRNIDNPNCQKYITQYFYSKKSIENFKEKIPKEISNKDRIYLIYTACSCLRCLLYNGYGNKISDLFYFLDFTKDGTIYNEAIEHNKKFINLLREDSEMFVFFLQINSGSSIDILSSKLTARISMLNICQVKSHLLTTIPKYGIRIKCDSHFNALTILETRITCICEIALFGFFLDDISNKIDYHYEYRFRISNLFKHEDMAHIQFALNYLLYNIYEGKSLRKVIEPLSPIRYYNIYEKEGNAEIFVKRNDNNVDDEIKGESGISLEYFLCRGDQKLINILRTECNNSKELFNRPELMAGKTLDEFIKILKENDSVLTESLGDKDNKKKFCLEKECEGRPFGYPRREKY